jgi:hypothetical protein
MLVRWKKQLVAAGVTGAVLIGGSLLQPRHLMAQVAKWALVRDADQPARGAFQINVPLTFGGGFVNVPIPSGKRLVVDYVALNGAAASSSGGIQPSVLFQSSLGANPAVTYYLTPTQSATAPTQFQHTEEVRIYADSLYVGLAYSGYAPSFLVFQASISGHLIDMP